MYPFFSECGKRQGHRDLTAEQSTGLITQINDVSDLSE